MSAEKPDNSPIGLTPVKQKV